MSIKPSPFSTQHGGAAFSLFLLVLFIGIVAAGLIAFISISHTNPLNPLFLEASAPEISWIDEPVGIGADPTKASISVVDDGAGIDEVIVRLVQNNQPRELTRVTIEETGLHEKRVDVAIDPKSLGLREGKAELQVLAFDKTLWSNSARLPKPLTVNFSKPRIDVITPQQNGVLGGSELVFFKVLGRKPAVTGVMSNGTIYSAFQAKAWDPSFKNYEDLYVAFFPLPPTFTEPRDAMTIGARDEIGNSAAASFNYKVRPRQWSSFRMRFNTKEGEAMLAALTPALQRGGVTIKATGDIATELTSAIKALARFDETALADTLSTSAAQRHWSGAFARPVASYPAHSAGDTRTILVNDTEILKSAAQGVRFPVGSRSPVVAANAGVVVFSGELGLLGKTVVIDHGLGLSTVYGHLSETSVLKSNTVEKGQTIGRTGRSGFAPAEEVYFETRVHGVAVSPNEWWDETWVNDHIEAKVAFVQRTLIGAPGE